MDFLVCELIKIVGVQVELLLVEIIFEMMLLLWRSPGRFEQRRFCIKAHMIQDFSNHFGVLDGSDDFHSATAFGASFHVNAKDPCEQSCPELDKHKVKSREGKKWSWAAVRNIVQRFEQKILIIKNGGLYELR
ncbi:MAG: hypothetical protein JNM24_05470 [Bdellovibrionaceae bacterium]|nr:hypothetical protein [Pseudobdellovibrionaceae bacterium]